MEQQYRSFKIKTNEVWFRAGKRGQLGFALSLANLGKMLQRLPEVRSLLMVVTDRMKAQCFICVYDPEAHFPACSFTCVSSDHYWGTIRLMSYCSIVTKHCRLESEGSLWVMLWAYDCLRIKGEHLKPNTSFKEATGSGEADWRTRPGGRREESEDRGVTWSNAEACEEGQLSSQPLETVNLWTQKTQANMAPTRRLFIISWGLRNTSKTVK